MSITGEGDATAASSYEGGGVGGKFRKRPIRRTNQTTPYDRPVNSPRGIAVTTTANDSNVSWLTKLVVDPASKFIYYGANRFFSSVFRKRLPAPPRRAPEAIHELSGGFQGAVPENQSGGQEPASGNGSHLINSSVSGGISELEQLLKQKTFTRPEIEQLMGLLRSKAVEAPVRDDGKMIDALPKPLLDVERHQQFSSASLEKNEIEEDRSHGVISTPIANSKVLEDEIASPAELAKAYMGSRPSKLSPSMLGMRNQAVMEGSGLLSNVLFTPKPPIMSSTMKNAVNPEVPEYGSITPRSRGRSAIYNMARTPYSRVYPTEGIGSTNNGYGRLSSLSSRFAVERDRQFGPNKLTLKRRSSMLDDDLGSVGPIRRIRQKPSLLSHRSPLPLGSHAARISLKQKLPLEDEPRHKISKTLGENGDNSTPSTIYTPVPSESSKVAARIFQQLENMTSKDKSSESKPAAAREKLPLKLKPIMLQDGHKLEGWPKATLPYARDSSQGQGEVEENGPKKSVGPSEMLTPTVNIGASLGKASRSMVETTDSALKTFASQPPQNTRASEKSAHEDYLEQDDNRHSNGPAPQPLGDRSGTTEIALNDGMPSPAELKLGKNSIQLELKSPSGPLSNKSSDMESFGVVVVGKRSTVFGSMASQAPSASFQSTLHPQSVFNFDKPKEANSSPPLLSFSSKVDDRASSFAISSSPSELSNRIQFTWSDTKPGSSSSSVNVLSTPTGAQQIIAESNKGGDQNTQKAGNTIGKSETVPSFTSNGSLVSSAPAFSFTPSTSIANFVTSGTAASSSCCHFGSNVAPSPIIDFSISADPSIAVSAPSTSNVSEPTVFQSKAENNTIFGGLNTRSSIASFATSSGSNTFGLGSSLASSTANGQSQSSFLGAASGFLTSAVGTVSQSTTIQFGTSASLSSFNISSSTSFDSSCFSSQASSPNSSFGFSSSLASSSVNNGIGSVNGPTSSLFKFGASSSDVNAVSSSGVATGLTSFGASSSSSGNNAIGSSNGPSVDIFRFSGSSSASTPGTNAASSSTSTSGIFKFGGNSSASSMFTTSTLLTGTSSSFATNTAPMVLNSSSCASSSPIFSFSAAPAAALLPVFGNPSSPFGISPANNNQRNTENSMAEDPVQSSAPSLPVFGQPSISPSPPGFMFGSPNPSRANPFQFGGQPNQVSQQNPSPIQASTSLEFNSGGSFSLGSGGDKSSRKIVKVNRNRNRRK